MISLLPLAGSAQPQDGGGTVVRFSGKPLRAKYSVVGTFQEALNEALANCGVLGIAADGVLGRRTRDGMRRLSGCPGFAGFGLAEGQVNDGRVTAELWRKLTGSPVPTVEMRAFVLWVTHEDTDFDTVQFNIRPDGTPQPNDPKSYITWGPYGATAGHGGEVQTILSDPRSGPPIRACFGAELSSVEDLAAARQSGGDAEAQRLVRAAAVAPTRRSAWLAGFACLGAEPEVRAAYQDHAFASGSWLAPGVRRLYGLVPDAERTEIDYAFFVDLTMHMSITEARVQAARDALEDAAPSGGRLAPAERRRTIGQALVAALSNQVEDRRGRNVVFYVDGIGEDGLSAQEARAWRNRTGLHASDFGLTDMPFQPDWLRRQ
jgi:hypothetical protein